ncbi:hypothetical protein [Haloarcula amylovorans]|uniref:hypothetical protein n=1 Tax=Haloarcula amylovorans TaxID=2562280 RepID=UPI00107671C4|nr:hypothetical protein [Halomicroarcula amylolytica]
MFQELKGSLSSFVESWDDSLTERYAALTLNADDVSPEASQDLIADIEELSEFARLRPLKFEIIGADEQYSINYNPSTGSITGSRDRNGPSAIDDLYRGQDALIDVLAGLRDNTISTTDEIIEALELFHTVDQFQVDIQYTLPLDEIERALANELTGDRISVHFYIELDTFKREISDTSIAEIRGKLLDDRHTHSLVVILSLDNFVTGDGLSIYGLSRLHKYDANEGQSSKWRDQMEKIRRQTLIQEPEVRFLPPSFFQFDISSDQELETEAKKLFNPYVVIFSVLAIANTAEFVDDSTWRVRIQGRQYIEGEVVQSASEQIKVSSNGNSATIEITAELVKDVYALYSWIYDARADDRITVVRNVATLYANTLAELITDAEPILSSAQSNRQFYVKESVDEFFEFRQDLTESAFNIQSEYVRLRSELMNDLSRDLFRTFAFIVIIGATVVFRLDDLLPPTPTYIGVATLLGVYCLITLRRIFGIRNQFIDLVGSQTEQVDFYKKFFSDKELTQRGIGLETTSPWWGRPFRWWWNIRNKDPNQAKVKYGFALDLLIYYILILVVLCIAALLTLEALSITDFITQIPSA